MDENAQQVNELKKAKEQLQHFQHQEQLKNTPLQQHNSQQQNNEPKTNNAGKSPSNTIHVSLPVEQVRNKVQDYSERCLIGSIIWPKTLHGCHEGLDKGLLDQHRSGSHLNTSLYQRATTFLCSKKPVWP